MALRNGGARIQVYDLQGHAREKLKGWVLRREAEGRIWASLADDE